MTRVDRIEISKYAIEEAIKGIAELQREKVRIAISENDEPTYTHDNGEVEAFDTKEDYIKYVISPKIRDFENEIEYYTKKLIDLKVGVYNA